MKKYLIVDTWNGEGYSEENKILEIKEFASVEEAKAYAKKLALEQVFDDEDGIVEEDSFVNYLVEEDAGAIHFIELEDDDFGVSILCNINSVEVLKFQDYVRAFENALEQANKEDSLNASLMNDRNFIGAYKEDYDYQFELIKR